MTIEFSKAFEDIRRKLLLLLQIFILWRNNFVTVHKVDRLCHSRMFLAGIHISFGKWMPN